MGEEDRGPEARRAMGSQEEFFTRYWPRLLRVLLSQSSNFCLAEEVAADTFMAAWSSWDMLLTHPRPDAWLFLVGIRKIRRLEQKARSRDSLAEDQVASEADLRLATLDEWSAGHLALVAAVRVLPRRLAEVVTLRKLEGFTVKETAEILGVTESTVKKQLSRAMAKLRILLAEPGQPDITRRNPS